MKTYELYIKTEPCGEYTFGRLSNNDIYELRKVFKNDKALMELEIYMSPDIYDDLGYAFGVGTGLNGESDGFEGKPKYLQEDQIDAFKMEMEDEEFTNGVYLVFSAPTKMSMYVDLEIDENGMDFDKLIIGYKTIDIQFIKDSYGDIFNHIITSIKYDGIDYDMEFVDRGFSNEVTIFQIYNDEFREIVSWRDSDIKWKNELLGVTPEYQNNISK